MPDDPRRPGRGRPTDDRPPHLAHLERADPGDVALGRALSLVRFLRERCPWDARQDARSLRAYLLEEAHEVADAIVAGDEPELAAELGDLLLNVAFQIVLGEERDAFDGPAVVQRLEAKMRARHPHIYGDAEEPPDWEALKARERAAEAQAGDPFRGIPVGLEPLSRALRVQDRMSALGFDWPDAWGPLAKVREETDEVEARLREARLPGAGPELAPEESTELVETRDAPDAELLEELGDLLFAAVNLARRAGVHPSDALLRSTRKFERRSRHVRRLAAERGLEWEGASLEELDALWDETKDRERDELGS